MNKNPLQRLGSKRGAEEVKAHPYFGDVHWEDVYQRKTKPPEAYLAEYAKNIIQISPYMAAGHPKTRGKMCQKDHPHYIQGWSFAADSRHSENKQSQLQGGGLPAITDDEPFERK